MDYEKKYKEALAHAREIHRNEVEKRHDMEWLFPELKESDDERIRTLLISSVKNEMPIASEHNKELAIAWLEKQEGNLVENGYTNNKDIIKYADNYSHEIWHKLMDNFKNIKDYYIGCNDVSDIVLNAIIDTYNWLEKQGEPKILGIGVEHSSGVLKECLDKVKPKFNEGDWITNGDYTWKIVDVKPLDYILQSQDGNIVDDTISYVDEQFHSFTIEDAKDGDVLFSPSHNLLWIFKDKETYHISINLNYANFISFGADIVIPSDVGPATKEQRDLLFSKMHEAGYEWDANKKEFKKKPQRMISAEAKEAIFNKPTWSEEDEERFQSCLNILRAKGLMGVTETINTKWLKSIKERLKGE